MKTTLSSVLHRAGDFFMERSPIHEAAERIRRALDELGIPFAVAGALAANAHGHVRTTEDVDILITPEGLATFKQLLRQLSLFAPPPSSVESALRELDPERLAPIEALLELKRLRELL